MLNPSIIKTYYLKNRVKNPVNFTLTQKQVVDGQWISDMVSEQNFRHFANKLDLPPGRPSFITRVLGVDSVRFGVWQARRARSHQVAQAPGALLPGACWRGMSAA